MTNPELVVQHEVMHTPAGDENLTNVKGSENENIQDSVIIGDPSADLALFAEAAGDHLPTDINHQWTMKDLLASSDSEISDEDTRMNNSVMLPNSSEDEAASLPVSAENLSDRLRAWINELPHMERTTRATGIDTDTQAEINAVTPKPTEKLKKPDAIDMLQEKDNAVIQAYIIDNERYELRATSSVGSVASSAGSTKKTNQTWLIEEGAIRLKDARLELLNKLKTGAKLRERVDLFDGALIKEMIPVFDPAPRENQAGNVDDIHNETRDGLGKRLARGMVDDSGLNDGYVDAAASEGGIDNDEEEQREEVNEDADYREKMWEQIQMCRAKHGGL